MVIDDILVLLSLQERSDNLIINSNNFLAQFIIVQKYNLSVSALTLNFNPQQDLTKL